MRFLIVFFSLILSNLSVAQEIMDNRSENNYYLAETYYRQGEFEKATQLFKELYDKSPFNTTYLSRLISCYQETDQFLVAEKLLKDKLSKNPNETFLYIYLGQNFEKQQLQELATQQYDKAIKSLETFPAYGGLMGRVFRDYNLLDYAIIAYEKAMEKNENANYNFQIAQIYGEKGEFQNMFESYINLVDKNTSYLNVVQRYASTYITDDPENEANILFRKTLLKKSINNAKNEWNILLSWLFAQQKEYQKAFVQEKALFQRNEGSLDEIFTLGKMAFDDKDYDASKQCFQFIVENSFLNEEKIDANLYLAKIKVAKEDIETDAFFNSLFQEFGKNTATIALQVEYANFLTFQKNDTEKANQILEEALTYANSKFDEARIKLKLGDVLVYRGMFNKALIYFSQIQTQLKGDEIAQEARFKVAQTSYFKGDFEWAKAQLKVLKGSTTQLIANDAVDLYLKIVDNEPVDSIPSGLKQLAKAELLAYQNKNEDAMQIVDELFSVENDKENEFKVTVNPGDVLYDDALFFKAKLYIKLKRYEDAILSFAEIVAADNQGFLTDDVYYQMAELYHYHLKNIEKAKEYYQKIIFEHPSSIYLVDARKKFRKLRGDNL